jgi:hypothetical protein
VRVIKAGLSDRHGVPQPLGSVVDVTDENQVTVDAWIAAGFATPISRPWTEPAATRRYINGETSFDPDMKLPKIRVTPVNGGMLGIGRSRIITKKGMELEVPENWAPYAYLLGKIVFDPSHLTPRGKRFFDAWVKWAELHGGEICTNMLGAPVY